MRVSEVTDLGDLFSRIAKPVDYGPLVRMTPSEVKKFLPDADTSDPMIARTGWGAVMLDGDTVVIRIKALGYERRFSGVRQAADSAKRIASLEVRPSPGQLEDSGFGRFR